MAQEEKPIIEFKPLKSLPEGMPQIVTVRLHSWMTEYEQALEKARVWSYLIPGQLLSVYFEDRYETDVKGLRPIYEKRWKEFLQTEAGQNFQKNWKRVPWA